MFMQTRLVHIEKTRSGARAERTETLRTSEIKVGRGTDNQIQIPGLSVPFHHCTILEQAGGARIEAQAGLTLIVNGRIAVAKQLAAGDVVGIAGHEIRVLEVERGRLALEVERVESVQSEADALWSRTSIGVERGFLSRRFLSCAMLVLVLGFFLGLPLMSSRKSAEDERPLGGVMQTARWAEATWNVGVISHAHRAAAKDCQSCHLRGFEPVADAQCRECHESMNDPTFAHTAGGDAAAIACTGCHREHEGDSGLTRVPDRKCTACHGAIGTVYEGTTLGNVTDFALGHPEFRPVVVVDGGSRVRVSLDRLAAADPEGPAERSGLKFPHRVHLAPDLRSPEGRVELACEDCHEPQAGGSLMTPVVFEEHCSGCHSLAFSEEDPSRQLPHSDPATVRTAIYEFFSTKALEDIRAVRGPIGRSVRRPGKRLSETERQDALAWAQEQSSIATEVVLGTEGPCAPCHTMEGAIEERAVAPVRIVPLRTGDRWLPLAAFEHDVHRRMPCEDCHPATDADSASAVLLPSIDSCRDCHVGEEVAYGKVTSPCVSCHRYHAVAHHELLALDSRR